MESDATVPTEGRPTPALSDTRLLLLCGAALTLLHILVNGQYGFHRDELALAR